ncbi:MAG TPA: DoxX family protein [Gemmatimonadaceae bacterium]|nr:DoxX family protein [Gemmatimonadaceae bacterium]
MKPTTRLWTAQAVLSALFLFAGVSKLITPTDLLAAQSHMPGDFIKFIGICETLGAFGLILPGLTKIRTGLTPLAAAGLVIIMIGAVVTSIIQGAGLGSAFPGVVGLLAFYVARGRWPKTVPQSEVILEPTVLRRAA